MPLPRLGDEKTPSNVDERAGPQYELITKQEPPTKPQPLELPTLRYRHRALWLLAIYVPLLLIPWALTCLLTYRPAGSSSYLDQHGFTGGNIATQKRLINALAVLNSFTSIITIPIVSALIAQAAVVYTQRRHKNQSVSVRQAFALADRGWSNPSILYEAWPPWKMNDSGSRGRPGWRGPGSGFLWLAAVYLFICGIQQPIREALVSTKQVLVVTTQDNPTALDKGTYAKARYVPVGFDPEPDDMHTIPERIVVQELANKLASMPGHDVPTNLWPDLESSTPFELSDDIDLPRAGPWQQRQTGYFVAAFPNGTTTGVLRHRVMRFNSSVACTEIEQSSFPLSCKDQALFTASFSQSDQLGLRICVPGQRGLFPWSISRRRQDIAEEMFVDVNTTDSSGAPMNYTRHCIAKTTRGYFEMGNYRNEYVPGPLLENWFESQDPFAVKGEFNDHLAELWRDNNTIVIDEGRAVFKWFNGRWRRPLDEDRVTDICGW